MVILERRTQRGVRCFGDRRGSLGSCGFLHGARRVSGAMVVRSWPMPAYLKIPVAACSICARRAAPISLSLFLPRPLQGMHDAVNDRLQRAFKADAVLKARPPSPPPSHGASQLGAVGGRGACGREGAPAAAGLQGLDISAK